VEIALRLKDRHGGEVILLSMGPPFVEEHLRVALAMGADEAYLLSDREFGGADTLATTYTLARAIDRIGRPDLVVCGEESSDGATAQVPPGLAEWLDCAQVTYVTEAAIEQSGARLWARRSLPGGYEVLSTSLPAVISVGSRATSPRFMEMERRPWAASTPVTVWDADDLDPDRDAIGMAGSPTVVAGTREAEQRERRREMLAGTVPEQVRALVERLGPSLVTGPADEVPAIVGPLEQAVADVRPLQPSGTTAQRLSRAARNPRRDRVRR
jgi:electron transfer flavoprotein beta subunit